MADWQPKRGRRPGSEGEYVMWCRLLQEVPIRLKIEWMEEREAAASFSKILTCACVLSLPSPFFQTLANKERVRAMVVDDQSEGKVLEWCSSMNSQRYEGGGDIYGQHMHTPMAWHGRFPLHAKQKGDKERCQNSHQLDQDGVRMMDVA
jgi:hypothetical protein